MQIYIRIFHYLLKYITYYYKFFYNKKVDFLLLLNIQEYMLLSAFIELEIFLLKLEKE